MKTSRKVHVCGLCFFIPSWQCTAMQNNVRSLPISYNFRFMLLLVR